MNILQFFRDAVVGAILISFVFLSPSLTMASANNGTNGNDNNGGGTGGNGVKIRVVAESDSEASKAVEHGCNVVRETRGLKALTCSQNVAETLGLREDLRAFETDVGANAQIGADKVQSSNDTGVGRKIAVLDTGCNYNHPDLMTSCTQAGMDYVNDDFDPFDDNGHGSHVAGLITGDGVFSPAKGVAPGAQIIPVKVLDKYGSGYFSDIIAAIYWVVDGPDGIAGNVDDPKVDAISMSLGTSAPYLYKGYCDSVFPTLTDAIKYAASRGVVVVVAAGNSGSSGVSIPGCISYSTTVGAVYTTDSLASFSGIGKAVDIVAPGVNLVSTWLGNGYVTASGTSMSTPIISGTVALIKYTHPGYTPSQVEAALYKTAKDLGRKGKDQYYGYGRVDASAALSYAP